jgi:IS4 transposase
MRILIVYEIWLQHQNVRVSLTSLEYDTDHIKFADKWFFSFITLYYILLITFCILYIWLYVLYASV